MKNFSKLFCAFGLLLVCFMLIGKIFFTTFLTDTVSANLHLHFSAHNQEQSFKSANDILVEENDPEEKITDVGFAIIGQLIFLFNTCLHIQPALYEKPIVSESLFRLWSAPPLFILFQQQKSFLA